MPFQFSPEDAKALIPSAGGSMCEKFVKALRLPYLFWQFVSYFVTEGLEWTDEFKADWCASSCAGTSGGTGSLPAPTISASDGAFADKIQITWAAVTGATTYDLYRHTMDDSQAAVVIASGVTG